MPGPPGRSGSRGLPGVQGPAGRRGSKGANGVPGPNGKKGKDGKPGRNGKHGKAGPAGKPGPDGKKGPKGDSCKSELQIHLNALKSYVDMKLARSSEGDMELGEDDDVGLGDMETQLQQSM